MLMQRLMVKPNYQKNDPKEIKDCFETFNRVSFAFNQALDGIIFKPVAKAYRVLPSPIRSGVNNSLDNLSNLVLFQIIFFKENLKRLELILEDYY